ncbi:MAG: rRNA maturation RNase YbeY [Bacteroidetes bacterium]|nr:rRNA maturation RNase YbeY [Bacteroidota bacterium]
MPIRFFYEEVDFKVKNPLKLKKWITASAKREGKRLAEVNYIFCSDEYLLNLNKEFLNHNTLTDIITFDNSDNTGEISAEIYISIERVVENSKKYGIKEETELHRVIIHGILHLCGYKDKKTKDAALMRKKEDTYLSLRKSFT